MKRTLAIVASFAFLGLSSCRYEPNGFETDINTLILLYSEGKIKEFTYIDKGAWILAELTKEAISSQKYSDQVDYLLQKKVISNKNEFRLMAKVISMEDFKENVREKTGNIPEIRRDELK